MKPRNELSPETAENVAIQALTFLAAEPERMDRFLALSGLDPGLIRVAAAAPGFLAGVLEHMAGNESLLVEFARSAGMQPEDVDRARAILGGRQWQRDMP